MNTQVGFVHAFKDFWFRAGDFRGSSTRGQYWWIFLMNTLVAVIGVGILLVSGVAATFLSWNQNENQPLEYVFGGFLGIVVVLILEWFLFQGLPSWALLIRRYRDAGVSPWLLLITRVVPIFLTGLAISTTAVQITIGILYLADLVIKVLPTRHPVPLWSTRPNEDGRRVGMVGAIPEFFRRAGVFSGRSSRSEYWWIVLWGGYYCRHLTDCCGSVDLIFNICRDDHTFGPGCWCFPRVVVDNRRRIRCEFLIHFTAIHFAPASFPGCRGEPVVVRGVMGRSVNYSDDCCKLAHHCDCVDCLLYSVADYTHYHGSAFEEAN